MTKHIKSDPETGRLIELQSDDDRNWFKDHPEHFIRIRFPNDGDRAGLKCVGQPFDDVNCVLVLNLKKGMRYRTLFVTDPFSDMWRAQRGEPYKDENFFPDVKRLLQQWQGKRFGTKLFREFKRRCKRGLGTS